MFCFVLFFLFVEIYLKIWTEIQKKNLHLNRMLSKHNCVAGKTLCKAFEQKKLIKPILNSEP